MPHLAEELHRGRGEGIVLGEAQLGGEDTAFERRALGALDQRLPVQEVVFRHGPRGDAFGRVVGQRAVLLQEPAVGGGLRHVRDSRISERAEFSLGGNGGFSISLVNSPSTCRSPPEVVVDEVSSLTCY